MLRLTPEILAGAYTFLRTTPPFRRWKLPPAHRVKFRVNHSKKFMGLYYYDETQIEISDFFHSQPQTLMATMAHEMIHLYQRVANKKTSRAIHDAGFHRMAQQVCRVHGFDLKAF